MKNSIYSKERLLEFKQTLKASSEQILAESTKLDDLANRMVKQVYIEKKNVVLAKVERSWDWYYELEKIDNDYLLARYIWRDRSLSEHEGDWMVSRTTLTDEEVARLDPENYEAGLLELALEVDLDQWRFGI